MNTQDFFSKVTLGEYGKPVKPWESRIPIPPHIVSIFNSFAGPFDEHIATSIPLYRELQLTLAEVIVKNAYISPWTSLYDIGGSEGAWIKTLSILGVECTINVDCNKDMQKAFNSNLPDTINICQFALASFLEPTDGVPKFVPPVKANIVHAGMAFQFMSFNRNACIEEVINNYLLPNGLFLIEEKLLTGDEWEEGELFKDNFKRQYYTEEQLQAKENDVLKNMHNNLVSKEDLLSVLYEHFENVYCYYKAGNFYGYACSNSVHTINRFIWEMPLNLVL